MKNKDSNSKQLETKIDNNHIFSKENVNLGYQPEFDYVKALLVFLIVITHIYLSYSNGCLFILLVVLLSIITASAPMFMMGVGMKYSRHHEPKYYFSRGIVLLTMSQFLNLVRESIPNVIAWFITGNKNFISRSLLVLQTDILTFAGIAFLFFALLKKMKLSDKSILIVGIIMNISSFILYKIMKTPNNFLVSIFLGFFVVTNAESYFPFCSYFIFVAFGYWLGGIYQKISNKDKFYNRFLLFCLPIVTIFIYLRITENIPYFNQYKPIEIYSLMPGPIAFMYCLVNLTVSAIFYKIHRLLKEKTPEFVKHCAKNFNQYYMISYTITLQMNTFLMIIKGENYPAEFKYPTLFGFIVLFLCRILIDMNDKYIHFTITTLRKPMRTYIFILIWIMTFIIVAYAYPKIEVYATVWNNYLTEID